MVHAWEDGSLSSNSRKMSTTSKPSPTVDLSSASNISLSQWVSGLAASGPPRILVEMKIPRGHLRPAERVGPRHQVLANSRWSQVWEPLHPKHPLIIHTNSRSWKDVFPRTSALLVCGYLSFLSLPAETTEGSRRHETKSRISKAPKSPLLTFHQHGPPWALYPRKV